MDETSVEAHERAKAFAGAVVAAMKRPPTLEVALLLLARTERRGRRLNYWFRARYCREHGHMWDPPPGRHCARCGRNLDIETPFLSAR